MKRALITGGAGFIAHHLVSQILKNTDWEVVTLDRLDFSGNLNRLHDILQDFSPADRARVNVVYHDLKAAVNPLIAANIGKVDYILHLAAGSHVDRSIEYPMEFVMDNVVATCNILDYARSLDHLERFVYFGTDEVFGPAPNGINYKENDRYNSTNPYSATKAGGEELAVAFENTYGLPVYITHTMNVFGQRQHPEKFIPKCIKNVRDGVPITIHSDITKTVPGSRHYIHAEDVSDALLFLLNQPPVVETNWGGAKCPKFNIVGAEELNNLQLAQIIADVQGKELKYEMVDFHSARPGHDLRYALCGEKMKEMGWEPQNIRERITEVVEWTLANERWIKL
jgi:dTDP-glucose 4,6-dehydratase|tara:strand:- start:1529 stop:2548 length:1020 start_codon:yes stop_codon:yes gene_type:complete